MQKYVVRQTLTFYWEVDANSKKEAITIAGEMGETRTSYSKYTNKIAVPKASSEMTEYREE